MNRTPPAPDDIRPEAKKLWKEVCQGWQLDEASFAVLKVAVISLSRVLDAREKLAEEGDTFTTPTGQVKRHPLNKVLKTERMGFLAAMRALELEPDNVEKPKPGRPCRSF